MPNAKYRGCDVERMAVEKKSIPPPLKHLNGAFADKALISSFVIGATFAPLKRFPYSLEANMVERYSDDSAVVLISIQSLAFIFHPAYETKHRDQFASKFLMVVKLSHLLLTDDEAC